MAERQGASGASGVALAVTALMLLSSCGGGSSPTPGPPSLGAPTPEPGATMVNGTERIAWNQDGDWSTLLFRAYVDEDQIALDSVTCQATASLPECSSPLPPLTDGVHRVAIVAVSAISGAESERSEPITLQKVSARSVVGAASLADGRAYTADAQRETIVTTSDGRAFTVDVIARGLESPVQIAATPDGRLLVAESDGKVSVVRPGEPDRSELALDARALLDPPPIGPLGLAVHPEFTHTPFVYVSFLAQEGPDRPRLRIVRLREVGDTLGEPATLFEAPIAVTPQPSRVADAGTQGVADALPANGPLIAFGPDGLLYALLPPGTEFAGEPAASRPHASMLRLADDGRVPDAGPLSGIIAHPLGFAWHPVTAALWGIVPGRNGEAVVETLAAGSTSEVQDTARPVLRLSQGAGPSSGGFVVQEVSGVDLRPFAAGLGLEAVGDVKLAVPVLVDGLLPGVAGSVVDVTAHGGTIYLATTDPGQPGGVSAVVVRLQPRLK